MSSAVCGIKIMLVGYTVALYKLKLEICITAEPSVPSFFLSFCRLSRRRWTF